MLGTRRTINNWKMFQTIETGFSNAAKWNKDENKKIPATVVCCFILQNVAKQLNDEDFDFEFEDRYNDADNLNENENNCGAKSILHRGEQRRTEITILLHYWKTSWLIENVKKLS